MSLTKQELYLLKEVFTKVKYDELNEKYVIHLDDYIQLNLTKKQLKLLEEMCHENNIKLEKLPKQLTPKETQNLFNEYYKIKKELALSNKKEVRDILEQKIISIRNKLIEGHLYIVYKLASELITDDFSHEDKEDLYQDMYEILIDTIESYDNSKYPSFIYYLKRRMSYYELKTNNNESIDEVLGSISKDENFQIPSEYIDDALDENIFRSISKDIIMNVLDLLPPRRKKIMTLYYGLENERPHTQEEIAKIMGVHRSRINSIILQSLNKFRIYPYKNILLELYEDGSTHVGIENEYENKMINLFLKDGSSTTSKKIEQIEAEYFKKMPTKRIIEILDELPKLQRELLTLYYGIGVPVTRDAEIINKKTGISKSTIYEARRKALAQFKLILSRKYNSSELSEQQSNEYMLYQYLNNVHKKENNARKKGK